MKRYSFEIEQIKEILGNKSPDKINNIFLKIISAFSDAEHCPESGEYVPVSEDEKGNITEPDFAEKNTLTQEIHGQMIDIGSL